MKRLLFVFVLFFFSVLSTYGSEIFSDFHGRYIKEYISGDSLAADNSTEKAGKPLFISASETAKKTVQQIVLIRHGEPDLNKQGKFSRKEAKSFLVAYDTVGIILPAAQVFTCSDPDNIKVFCSPLQRAISTAKYLFGEDKEFTVSKDFREFETTLGDHSPKLKLPIKLWTTIARIKWILGIDRQGIESFKAAKQRAHKVAEQLVSASKDNGKVVLVAHGFLNRYVEKDLEKMGWKLVQDGGHGYLSKQLLIKTREE